MEILNPADNSLIKTLEATPIDKLDDCVCLAKQAQQKWSQVAVQKRADILLRAAQLIADNADSLAKLEMKNTGKPIAETSTVDIPSSIDTLKYFAGVAQQIEGIAQSTDSGMFYTRREPLGVTVGIGAWNYPLQIACWKSAPAIACGNAMLYKPSELTPLTALELENIYLQAGLPKGLFQVLLGDGQLGQAMTTHQEIAKVSLTGSVRSGQKVLINASCNFVPATLELGGKSPLIVLADADIEKAVDIAILANFYSCGEVCSNGTRVFVHENIKPDFLGLLKTKTEQLKVGQPSDEATKIGALISREHMQKVLKYIDIAKQQGAKLLTGGYRCEDGKQSQGNFVKPTVFYDCHDEMTHVQEEIFGPVMSVLSFNSIDDVITRANKSTFGLAAGVVTKDIAQGHKIAHQLQAGVCWVNNYNLTPLGMPFGGVKYSGMGRENAKCVVDHYTKQKSVYIELADTIETM